MTDLDKLEALAKAAMLPMSVKTMRMHEDAVRKFRSAANPATILDLIASARRDAEEIERLIGYAVHDDACTANRFPGQDVCSCGLSSLLQRVRHGSARAAHTGEG